MIALDYDMHAGKTMIRVRKALLYYALRRLGLDTDPSARRPQDQQIILLNRVHIDHLLGTAESEWELSMVTGGKRLKPMIGPGSECLAIESRACFAVFKYFGRVEIAHA